MRRDIAIEDEIFGTKFRDFETPRSVFRAVPSSFRFRIVSMPSEANSADPFPRGAQNHTHQVDDFVSGHRYASTTRRARPVSARASFSKDLIPDVDPTDKCLRWSWARRM
jgi:hypothetical protein